LKFIVQNLLHVYGKQIGLLRVHYLSLMGFYTGLENATYSKFWI